MSYPNQPYGGQGPADQTPYGQGQYAQVQQWPEESQATMILVLGILGLVACQILAPVAWVMGNKEMAAIDAGLRSPEGRSNANVGRILGIVGTVLIVLLILFYVVFFVLIIGLGAASSTAQLSFGAV